MAFDHNSLSKDLRPLNTARRVVEEPFVPTSTATGRNIDGGILNQNVGSPSALSVYYPDSVYAGLGYGNQISGVGGCCQRVPVPVPILTARQAVANNMGIGLSCSNSPIFHHQGSGNSNDLVSDEGGDDSSRGKKVKLVCSFGGKILPRPGDGMLRYVGGHTRIISVRRDISFNELVQKMTDTCGQLAVVKYQLPEEDLDALVSVSCSEDLENMMDEYEKLVERSPDGSAKLKVFLFSASDCDSLGMVLQDDSRDSRQKYVYAVNGIMDGVGVGIARKESIASAGSTQNSELSGTEGGDSLGPATEVNVMGLPASNMYIGGESVIMPQANNKLYPAGNSTSSHENTPKLACVDSNPLVDSDSYAMPVGTPIVKPGPLLTLLSQPDTEAERSVPLTMQHEQVRSDSRKYIAEIPPPVQYLQAYVTPHQQATNTGGYLQLPSQIGGFPSPQLMGTSSSVLSRCQVPENLVGVNADVPIPSGHVSMMPSSNIVLRPTFVQRQMLPSLARLDNNHDDMTYGPRFLQVPADHCCGTYQVQVPPSVVREGYGWNQVPAPAHVMVSDGLASHQQLTFVDKFLRIGDCYMCQRALPHAHSDPLTQEQRLSNTNSVYHSLHTGDRGQQINRDMVNEVLGEGIVQGSGAQAKIFSQLDQQVLPPQFIPADFSQNIQGKLENEKMFLPQTDNLDYSGVSVPQEMMSLAAQASQGVNLNNTRTDEAYHSQQPVVPTPYLVKQDAFVSKPVYNEVPPFDGIAVKPMEHFVQESPKDNYADLVPRKVFLQPSMLSENLKGVDESMEALRISPLEDIFSVQHSRSNMPRNGDLLDHKPQHMRGRNVGVFLDEAFSNHGKVKESNQIMVTNALSCLNAEVPYLHNFHPTQSCGIAQQPNMIDPGSYLHSDTGAYLSNEVCNSNPASSVVHPFCTSNLVPSVSERKDDAPKFLPKMFSDGLETVNSNASCIIPPPASASDGSGEVEYSSNSTFNNRDPWDMQRDIHFVPLCKAGAITEARGVKDQFNENCNREVNKERRVETEMLQPLGTTDKDFNFALDYSGKDSDEELIKHELQTIAEDVAATVLHSTTSNPDFAHKLSESYSKKNQERTAQRIDVEVHNSPQLEDIKSKMPEKINLGFPVSDGLGRLQIIKNSDLEELRELGSGTFGTVYHGKWRGTDVAIKRINDRCFAGKPSEQERMREDFWNEAINLADLHHPNVVAFYGVVLDGPGGSVATVTEFMVNGSLRNALQKNERNLDKRKKLLIAMDVAFGMEYLHGKNIVHFDLKSDNLLVNLRDSHRPICKVGDLGLSKVKCHTLISGGVRGTLPWMAPELLNGSSNLVSEKVDVFSFGIVLWEILTGEEPYKDLHYGAIIGGIVSNTLRPTVPESCDPEWKLLMERCWSAEQLERPSFEEIGNQLRTMSSKIPVRGQGQQQNDGQTLMQK